MTGGPPEEMDRATPSADMDGTATAQDGSDFFGEDGLTFGDFIDIINPLQHIPGVSTLYRSLTGDEISPGARMAGGTLYGGPVGFASALANNVLEETTGTDIAGNVLAAFSGPEAPGGIADPASGIQTASLPDGNLPAAAALQAQGLPGATSNARPDAGDRRHRAGRRFQPAFRGTADRQRPDFRRPADAPIAAGRSECDGGCRAGTDFGSAGRRPGGPSVFRQHAGAGSS